MGFCRRTAEISADGDRTKAVVEILRNAQTFRENMEFGVVHNKLKQKPKYDYETCDH